MLRGEWLPSPCHVSSSSCHRLAGGGSAAFWRLGHPWHLIFSCILNPSVLPATGREVAPASSFPPPLSLSRAHTHHNQEASEVLEGRESVPARLDLCRVRMADPDGMEDEGEGVREVGRVECRRRQPLGRLGSRSQKGTVGHGGCWCVAYGAVAGGAVPGWVVAGRSAASSYPMISILYSICVVAPRTSTPRPCRPAAAPPRPEGEVPSRSRQNEGPGGVGEWCSSRKSRKSKKSGQTRSRVESNMMRYCNCTCEDTRLRRGFMPRRVQEMDGWMGACYKVYSTLLCFLQRQVLLLPINLGTVLYLASFFNDTTA